MTWVTDKWDESKGRTLSVKVTSKIVEEKTEFQKIEIYESDSFGKMLVLDGVINVTEFDEHCYHEMIAHIPLFIHPEPKKVLIIGGGDGGTAREALKHASVTQVDVCEIDKRVIELSKEHFKQTACAYDDPRVKVHFQDGARFVRENKGYDVIIVDSSDPWGPAETLFKESFYQDMHDALTSDGVVSTQCESMFYDKAIIQRILSFGSRMFTHARYCYTLVPTYPSGTIGFFIGSKAKDPLSPRKTDIAGLNYYSWEMHQSSFVLPPGVAGAIMPRV